MNRIAAVYFLLLCALLVSSRAWSAPTLTVQSASAYTGAAVNLPITFDSGGTSVASLQFDLQLPAGVSPMVYSTGTILITAGKSIWDAKSGNQWRFVAFGLNGTNQSLNQNTISVGTIATVQLQISNTAAPGPVNVNLANAVFVDPSANALSAGALTAGTLTLFSACDVNKSGTTDVLDNRLETNMGLNLTGCTDDITHDGSCNIFDNRRITNVILGGTCVVGP